MKTFGKIALVTGLLVLGTTAWSFDAVEEMLFRSKIEKSIGEKYSDAIATKLPRDQFNVSVQVVLEPIPGTSKKERLAKEKEEKAKAEEQAKIAAKEKEEKDAAERAQALAQQKKADEEKPRLPASENNAQAEQKTEEATKSQTEEIRPSDLTLGMIDAEALIEHQRQEIADLRAESRRPASMAPQIINVASSPAPVAAPASTVIQPVIQPVFQNSAAPSEDEDRPSYKIAKVFVTVGVAKRLPMGYLSDLQGWVSKRVGSEFGSSGRALVEHMEEAPPPPKEKEPEAKAQEAQKPAPPMPAPEKAPMTPEERWLNRFSATQNFLGLAMLAIAAIFGLVLWKFVAGRDEGGRDIALKLQGGEGRPNAFGGSAAPTMMIAAPAGASASPGSGSDDERSLHLKMRLAKTRDLTNKIGTLAFELEDRLGDLVPAWLENGEDGYMKTACLIDTMMNFAALEGAESVDWDLPIPAEHERHMAKVFQMMSHIEPEHRLVLLEEAYWDLVSAKTLATEKPKHLFSYLRSIDESNLQKVLRGVDARTRAVALYHLEDDQQTAFMRSLSPEERAAVFAEAARSDKMTPQELDQYDQILRHEVNRTVIQQPEIDFQRQLSELLDRMTPIEELHLLPKIAAELPDGGLAIRRQKASLAFVDRWSLRARQLVFGTASVEEITSLLRLRPEFKAPVLSVCAPRIAEIIEDDLKIMRMNANDSVGPVNALNLRLKNLLANRELTAADMAGTAGEGMNAA